MTNVQQISFNKGLGTDTNKPDFRAGNDLGNKNLSSTSSNLTDARNSSNPNKDYFSIRGIDDVNQIRFKLNAALDEPSATTPLQSFARTTIPFSDAKIISDRAYGANLGESITLTDGRKATITDVRQDTNTGFRAVVFTDDVGNKIIGYAGSSEPNPFNKDARLDWKTNISNVLGNVPKQYHQGLKLAQEYKALYGVDKVILAGHSLGGGIAAYASINTDIPAVGINSAPLGKGTFPIAQRNNPALTDQITDYSAEGELTTDIVKNPFLGGQLSNVKPGDQITVPGALKEVPPDRFSFLDDIYNFGVSIFNHQLENTAPND